MSAGNGHSVNAGDIPCRGADGCYPIPEKNPPGLKPLHGGLRGLRAQVVMRSSIKPLVASGRHQRLCVGGGPRIPFLGLSGAWVSNGNPGAWQEGPNLQQQWGRLIN